MHAASVNFKGVKFFTGKKTLGTPVAWSGWAAAAHYSQHYCTAGPFGPLPDNYALSTDKRTKTNKNRKTVSLCKAYSLDPLYGGEGG